MSGRTSFNVGPIADKNRFVQFMADYRPSVVTIMNDYDLCSRTYEATQGQTIVVHRIWSEDDGKLWQYTDPKDFATRLIGWTPNKNIWKYVLNEPGASTQEDITKRNNFISEVGYWLAERGHHAILGNIGPATWEKAHVEAGWYDKYIRDLAYFSDNNLHYGGWHYYTLGYLPFGTGLVPVDWLTKREMLQPENWPKRSDLPIARRANGALPNYWHILRSAWFDIRANEIGVKPHKRVITECWWDRMPDMTYSPGNIYDIWTNRFGTNGYPVMRGPRTYAGVYKWAWPQWTFEEAIFQQCMWAEDVLPDWYVGFCIFTLSHRSEWDIEYGFNLEPNSDLFTKLRSRRGTDPMPPFTDMKEVTLVTPDAKGLRVRTIRGVAGPIVGVLNNGERVKYSPKSINHEVINDFRWAYVESQERPGLSGWCALLNEEAVQFVPITPPPPPPEEPKEPFWLPLLSDDRMRKVVLNACEYAKDPFGDVGSNLKLAIAELVTLLEAEHDR